MWNPFILSGFAEGYAETGDRLSTNGLIDNPHPNLPNNMGKEILWIPD